MNLKKEQGITLTALALTVVIMFVLVGVSLTSGYSAIKDIRIGRLVSYMDLVQSKVEIISENYNFYNNDTDYLVGVGPYKTGELENISLSKEEISLISEEAGVSTADVENWDWYKWDQNDLMQQNLDKNMLGNGEFYYVNYEYAEILHSKGTDIEGIDYYSLTGLSEGL